MKTILRLLGFLRPFSGWVILSVVLGSAAIAAGIGLLGTSASLIARAALHPSIASLQVAIVGVRFFGLSRGVFRYLERLTSHSTNFRLLAGLRSWFYRSIEPLSPVGLLNMQSGDLLARAIGDIETLENFYVRIVAPPVTAGIVTLGVGWFTGSLDLRAGLALVGGLLVGGILIPIIAYWVNRTTGRRLVEARARISAMLVEGLQGISDLTAFGWGGYYLERVADHYRTLASAQRRNGWVQGAVEALSLLTAQLTLAAVLWLAIPSVISGRLEGYLLAVLALVTLASFEAVAPLPQAAQQLESCLQSARRLFVLTDQGPAVLLPQAKENLTSLTSPLELMVDHLSYRYPGSEVDALKGVSLRLTAGKRLAVVGPSGAGKSTLVNLLLRFVEGPHGAVCVNGLPFADISEEHCRALFAVISQSTYLFSASIRQNLRMAKPEATDEELAVVIEKARLTEWVNALPAGLDTWAGEHGLHMSGGERQRLALARTLLKNAPILLLDEPTAHLDAVLEEQILNELLESSSGKSMILITHRLAGMDKMDEIIVLDDGLVVERGKHADLLARQGLYARMWAAQHRLFLE